MNWETAKNTEYNNYELPGDWLKLEYFEILNILFRVENALRVFVYVILKNEFQEKWKDLSITSDDQENSTINAIARKRLMQDKNYAYLGYTLNSPLLHLTSGELIRIVTSDTYWKLFKPYFLATKEIIKNKLDEIGNVRNSVAHFRPIKSGDISTVKQNSIHTLSEIEKTLKDFISCPDIVPTNTEMQWYKEIKSLSSEECSISFRQSQDEKWIKIIINFRCPIVKANYSWKTRYTIKTFNLKTTNLLNCYPLLTKHAICVTEQIPNLYVKDPETVDIAKRIIFTFSSKSLANNHLIVKEQIDNILLHISEETLLIKEDNLARGKLIEMVQCHFDKADSSEYFLIEGLQFVTKLDEESPVEFWGALNHVSNDFISNTNRFPWMPEPVSEDKGLPF